MDKDNNNNSSDLIDKLCEELTPVKPCCHYRRVALWFIGAWVYLAFMIWYLGLRPDFDMQLMKSSYMFEVGLAALILVSASLASSWLSFPDCLGRAWIKVVPIVLSIVFFLWAVFRSIEGGVSPITGLHLGHCAQEGMMMEVIPLLALVFMTMKGRTTQPYWSMAMNVLAVSTLGWIGLRLTCPVDEMGHSLFNHLLPFAVLAAALGLFARKLFKW